MSHRPSCRCTYCTTGEWPRGGPVNCWTPGRIIEHLNKGWVVPHDWREILTDAGYTVPPTQETLL